MTNEERKQREEQKKFAIETIKKADLEKCNLNQLITILNLFMHLDIPSRD